MNSTIFYHPDAYTTSGPKLMGRNAAGESFLEGFIRHHSESELWMLPAKTEYKDIFLRTLADLKCKKNLNIIDPINIHQLQIPGSIYYPGPGIGKYAFQRSFYGHDKWSVCGITHTTSSDKAMDAIADLLTAPVYPWDALICTSSAVKRNVENIIQAQIEYLSNRFGTIKTTPPSLPIIPLGIDAKKFEFTDSDKSQARSRLKIHDDEIVVLFMGRLSFHAKAHPLPMYKALQQAHEDTQQKVTLIECGWFANDFIKNSFVEASKQISPDINVIRIDGRVQVARNTAWAAADVFCSLSDNIQETFGITPIEAMAAGLPVVVSDWNGYKESVRDGIDGYRIATFIPTQGSGYDLALRHALDVDTYDQYCGYSSSLVAVDINHATMAFKQLFQSKNLRVQMGNEGRKRAKSYFDWSVIIPQYEDLWSNLHEIRNRSASMTQKVMKEWPARLDPFQSFSHYSTGIVHSSTRFSLAEIGFEQALEKYQQLVKLKMINFAKVISPTDDEIKGILVALRSGEQSAQQICNQCPEERKPFIFRSLVWLTKIGVLQIHHP